MGCECGGVGLDYSVKFSLDSEEIKETSEGKIWNFKIEW